MKIRDLVLISAVSDNNGKPVFAFGYDVSVLSAGEYSLHHMVEDYDDYTYSEWELHKNGEPVQSSIGSITYSDRQVCLLEISNVCYYDGAFHVELEQDKLEWLIAERPNGVSNYDNPFRFEDD